MVGGCVERRAPCVFLFLFFPARPPPLTPRAVHSTGDQKHSALPVCVHGLVQFKITCNIPHTLTSVKIEWLDHLGESWALLGGDRIYDTPAVVGRTASSRALGSATQPGTGCGVQFVRSAGGSR